MKIKGNKTYMTGISTIFCVAGTFFAGEIELVEALQLVVPAVMAMFVRNGIK